MNSCTSEDGNVNQSRTARLLALQCGPSYAANPMRLLDRYLLRELLIPLVYCLCGFLIFWISFDLFSELDDFQRYKLHALDVAQYYLVKIPKLLVDIVTPITLLLALLYALTNHARHQELTAMRAAGISLWRLCLPYLAVGFIFSVSLFAVNEWWVPRSAERADQILNRYAARQPGFAERDWHYNLNFKNARDHRLWNIGAYNVKSYEMKNPHVDWDLPDGSRRKLLAERAERMGGKWVFYNAQEFIYDATGSLVNAPQTNVLSATFSETPEQIKSEIKINDLGSLNFKEAKKVQLSTREILDFQSWHPQMEPRQRDWLNTKLHERFATPWTSLVVVLIAIPFGAPSGRRNVFVGVASSIFICFVYFVLKEFSLALGTGGHVAPWLAAWLPNLVFGGMGICLTMRVR